MGVGYGVGIAIAVERWLYLTKARVTNQKVWKQLAPLVADGKYNEAQEIARKSASAMGNVLSYGLNRIRSARRRDDIEKAMEESLLEVLPKLEKRTHYLATFANIATLLGLLGTIMGLIQAFTAVANANPAEKADLLSASISVAMNTTAFGLMVAIPLLVVHAILTSKTGDIVDSLEMATVKALNVFTRRAKRAAA